MPLYPHAVFNWQECASSAQSGSYASFALAAQSSLEVHASAPPGRLGARYEGSMLMVAALCPSEPLLVICSQSYQSATHLLQGVLHDSCTLHCQLRHLCIMNGVHLQLSSANSVYMYHAIELRAQVSAIYALVPRDRAQADKRG